MGIRRVAHEAQVSTASVSRTLNDPSSVSPALRARIEAVIERMGYIPHASARALSSRRTRTIGAIIPTIDNAMFARGVQSLQAYLDSVDYLLLLTTSGYDPDAELEQARNLVSRGVDGLILRGDCHHKELRDLLAARRLPYINVGIYDSSKPYACVGVDNAAAAGRAALHLVELGHTKFGVVAALRRNNDRASARIAGLTRVLEAHGLSVPASWFAEIRYHLDDARQAGRQILGQADRPTAVICGNDVLAYGVLLEAARLGLDVPRDLSIVGFDDLEWSRHLRPSLTTIQVPTDEIWRRAGEYVVGRLAGEHVSPHHEVDFSLVVRESTAPPPT